MWWLLVVAALLGFALWRWILLMGVDDLRYSLAQLDALYPQPDAQGAGHPRSRGKLPPVFLNGQGRMLRFGLALTGCCLQLAFDWMDARLSSGNCEESAYALEGLRAVCRARYGVCSCCDLPLISSTLPQDGTLSCLDAYCPHMGADLSVLGVVCGNGLQCGFHHWEFDTNVRFRN
jgi:hypothetical protein